MILYIIINFISEKGEDKINKLTCVCVCVCVKCCVFLSLYSSDSVAINNLCV